MLNGSLKADVNGAYRRQVEPYKASIGENGRSRRPKPQYGRVCMRRMTTLARGGLAVPPPPPPRGTEDPAFDRGIREDTILP
jgi:hypothetical protein